eukprot:CAMPEP_0175908896 /NCGR_PEP_ID=MMETSP0108-20121206/6829_1 /TAXON_ID=195067 ORGANISM="Goniomonas pacifica, Strain CCMP1869" /NCGR_SAMPLE_ID=MMETSP0108 /ASSEMBLY_ACC=CAM_ASM_000204 /LENGTH=869 /DNA_ID=CAMNT_0017230955 /DNA_START=3 /DNA_END=2610 /DNA_ORIENTATION=-
MHVDVALLNSGTLRADAVLPAGPLLMKDIVRLLPMLDQTIILGLAGQQLILALENGVSQWPKMEGRFPQVSGVKFQFDGSKPAGSRVVQDSVQVNGQRLELQGREYLVATKAYLALGKDGYDVFKECRVVQDGESCPILPTMVHNHFKMLETCKKLRGSTCEHKALQHAVDRFRKRTHCDETHEFCIKPDVDSGSAASPLNEVSLHAPTMVHNHFKLLARCEKQASGGADLGSSASREASRFASKHEHDCADHHFKISPEVQGRIVQVEATAQKISGKVTLLHFNDVYEIEERHQEPVGGAARFRTLVKSFAAEDPLVLFSGDAFNPSMLSTVTRGKHMVPILNALEVRASVFGNHDFDFGLHEAEKLAEQCNFPWLMSNAWFKATGKPLANGVPAMILEHNGRKIGLMGLIEREWLATLATVDEEDVEYVDFVEEGRRLALQLRGEGVDVVVALTHMRLPNDERLAQEVGEIDLVLGGHDHSTQLKQFGDTWLVKSGCDFRELTKVTMTFEEGSRPRFDITPFEVTSTIDENAAVKAVVDEFTEQLKEKMESRVGETDVDLDCRFASIRTKETNVGNFVADVMRQEMHVDVALLNSGTLRADAVLPAGPLLMKDIVRLLPMLDQTIILGLTGQQLILALENGVSQWPKMEGRFPQVSGVKFQFDGSKPAGSRVVQDSVQVNGQRLELQGREYLVATKAYLALGKDGYDVFKECRVVQDGESCPILPTMVHNHFKMLETCKKLRGSTCEHKALQHAVDRFRKRTHCDETHEFCIKPDVDSGSAASPLNEVSLHAPTMVHNHFKLLARCEKQASGGADLGSSASREASRFASKHEHDCADHHFKISPEVQGRIVQVEATAQKISGKVTLL